MKSIVSYINENQNLTIRNVTIGDKFKNGKHLTAEVVDFIENKSMVSGQIIGYTCIAKGVGGLSTNTFDVPFTQVLRNKI